MFRRTRDREPAALLRGQDGEPVYPDVVLGHRVDSGWDSAAPGTFFFDTYVSQPIPVARPAVHRCRASVRCARCGQPVRLVLWAPGSKREAILRWWFWFGLVTATGWSVAAVLLNGADANDEVWVGLLGGLWLLTLIVKSAHDLTHWLRYVRDDRWVDLVRPAVLHELLEPGTNQVKRFREEFRDMNADAGPI